MLCLQLVRLLGLMNEVFSLALSQLLTSFIYFAIEMLFLCEILWKACVKMDHDKFLNIKSEL